MDLKFRYDVRISVHGLIPITEQERAIKNTQVFQRLRKISQLAMTCLVYPSANHTRFEHSLGAMHVAWRIAKVLKLDVETQRIVRLAALLHDIGHGPFSHVSENVVDSLTKLEKAHEYYGAAIALYHPELQKLIGKKDREEVSRLIVPIQTEEREFPFEIEYLRNRTVAKDIVSGPSDADKMDYLLRDSHHCGVKYGEFDLDKVVTSALIIRSAGIEQLGFCDEAVWALEQMILARHHMHRQVYGHSTRAVTDAMLVRSMTEALQAGLLKRSDFDWTLWKGKPKEFLDHYLRWNDENLLGTLETASGIPGELAGRLKKRHLLKEAFREELRDIIVRNDLAEDLLGQLVDRSLFNRKRITSIEGIIAKELRIDPGLVIISLDSQRNPTYRPPAYQMEIELVPHDIILWRENGGNIAFSRMSEVFGSSEKERNYLTVYCPLEDNPNQRKKIQERVKKIVLQELTKFYQELNR